jgi:hypothetical protein
VERSFCLERRLHPSHRTNSYRSCDNQGTKTKSGWSDQSSPCSFCHESTSSPQFTAFQLNSTSPPNCKPKTSPLRRSCKPKICLFWMRLGAIRWLSCDSTTEHQCAIGFPIAIIRVCAGFSPNLAICFKHSTLAKGRSCRFIFILDTRALATGFCCWA